MTRKSTGIGSDLVSIIGAVEYARKTGRDVIIDWRKSRYLRDPAINLFSEIFEAPTQLAGVELRVAESQFSDRTLRAPLRFLTSKSSSFEDFHTEMSGESKLAQESVVVTRPMHHLPPDAVQRQWLSGIRPLPRLSATIDAFERQYMQGAPVVGIHIRHGNGETLGSGRDKLLERGVDDLIDLCLEHIRSMQIPTQTKIFLCTDSSELRERFEARTDRVFDYGSRIGTATTGPIHTNLYGLRGAEDAVAEMWLLARCNWLLYTPSWFSHYARMVGNFDADPVNLDTGSLYGSSALYEARLKENKSGFRSVLAALGFRK